MRTGEQLPRLTLRPPRHQYRCVSAGRHKDHDELQHIALNDPSRALDLANELLKSNCKDEDAISALRARGLAARQLGDLASSSADLEAAQLRADAIGNDDLWASAGLSLAGTRVFQGRVDEAKELLAACIDRASGEARVEAIYQLGTTFAQAGDLDTAVRHYAEALPLIQQLNKPTWEGNLLGNRGVMNIYRGYYEEAIADLDAAIKLHADQGPAMYSLHRGNKAYALQLRGDLPQAIDIYDENERFQREHDLPTLMYSQRCTAYLAAGMYEEAMDLAQQAHRFHSESEATLGAVEALLPGAEAALALERPALAQQLAQAAIDLDHEESFPALTARAKVSMIEARYMAGTSEPGDIDAAEALSSSVGDSDRATSARALFNAGRIALDSDRPAAASRLVDSAGALMESVPLHMRIEWNSLRARSEADDQAAVLEALAEGLSAFDELVSGVASYDVRYKAARHVHELSSRAIDVSLQRDPDSVVSMIERVRSGALRLDGRQAERGRAMLRDDESYLVWFVSSDQLLCITETCDGIEVHTCGDLQTINEILGEHRFVHRQLARRKRLEKSATAQLLKTAGRLDGTLADLLLPSGLRPRVVANPPAQLDGLLWAALPGLHDRRLALTPSLAIARRPLPSRIKDVAVAGDSALPFVPAELDAVCSVWSTEAGIAPEIDPLAALAGTDLVHLAGHFVADASNPLFSAIPLDGGRLRGADYLQLQPPPGLAVLSACHSGHGASVAGATVGFGSAVLASGTAAVILTHTTIEDGPTVVSSMEQLHQYLKAGIGPSEALLKIRSDSDPADRSAVSAFAVLGAGW